MNEGDAPSAGPAPGRFIDQPVSQPLACSQRGIEVGHAVTDVMNARAATAEKAGDRPVRAYWFEQLDFGAAEGQGDNAGAIGFLHQVRNDAEHVAVEGQGMVDAFNRNADMSDGSGHEGPLATRVQEAHERRNIPEEPEAGGVRILTEKAMADSKNTVPVTDDTFAGVVEKGQGLVLVDFWAEWCGPCRMIAPSLEQLAVQYQGKATIAKMDVDANMRTPMRFNVRSIPTLMFFKDGKHVDTVIGAVPKTTLEAKIQQHL
jgi:thioredoxin 1